MRFTLEDIKNRLFSPDNPTQLTLFNIIIPLGMIGGIFSIAISFTDMHFATQGGLCIAGMALLFGLFYLANWKRKVQLAAILSISLMGDIVFPIMFFVGGGIHSGMSSWFLLAIIYAFLVLDGTSFISVLAIQILVIIGCYTVAYQFPETVTNIATEFGQITDVVQSLLISSLIIGSIIKFQNRLNKHSLETIKKANEDLMDSELKAENANHAKSDFLSNMSHEIRTPINAILGMNEMILRECKDKKILEYASAVQSSSTALLSLVNDVLDLSKIESGKIEIKEEEYKLQDLILNSFGMVAERLEKKGLRGSIFCNENLPSGLIGDFSHLRQILINFLTNACKYTEKGNVDFFILGSVQGNEAKLIFSVKDTGIGIKEENRVNMFKKFERFDLQRNRNIEGTGLGLSISKQLCDLMGGKIDVKSEYGKGSEFIITVPQKVFDATPVGEVSPKSKQKEKEIQIYHQSFEAPDVDVLAVDDVELNLIVFENLLKETKMKIDLVESGAAAIERASEKHYDIIFMDYMMPEMDGIQTLEKLRSMDTPNNKTPVIVLTADALAGVREKYIRAGFKDYISKPVDGNQLEKMLIRYLPQQKVFLKTGKEDIPCGEKISRLKNMLPEFDYETALSYCDESEDFCIEIISEYCTNNHTSELKKNFEECEWENYRQRLHSLKSTSRTVGLQALAEEFKIQESAVKKCELDFAKKNHKHLMDHYALCINKMLEAGFVLEDDDEEIEDVDTEYIL
ncbi:MAG: response regulator [Treponema sp.]|nr:response regulator [Candidatus Treponema equi]